MVELYRCSHCQRELPAEAFHRGSGPAGKARRCKECQAKYRREYYWKHREQALKLSKKWVEENREQRRKYLREWWARQRAGA